MGLLVPFSAVNADLRERLVQSTGVRERRRANRTVCANPRGKELPWESRERHPGDIVYRARLRHLSGTRAAETGEYYTINGAALVFSPSEEGAGAVVGDGMGLQLTEAALSSNRN